ncbi:MAG TPA: hypothetical protein DD640_01170 [Clostridiales bacterium]|nr:hypothetical protein [Clostridiales bacterium]
MSDRTQSWPVMPLVEALLRFRRSDRISWHMPGHYSGRFWPRGLKTALPDLDVTELPLTDDLNHPAGPARQAMRLAADAFGAGITRFITSGSTTALHILLAATLGRGDCLLLPRCSHQAVLHAVALLDLEPCWLQPAELPDSASRFSLLPQILADTVDSALRENPRCRAVLVTSPDYYGGCPDLVAIAKAVHRHGAILLVDEAHGAHLGFAPDMLPPSAMAAGADACVQSGHKTLPVLTPGSYLQISQTALAQGSIDAANLERMIPVFQTSSPSFPVAATLDYARAWLVAEGRRQICYQLDRLDELAIHLGPDIFCSPRSMRPAPNYPGLRDPLRLIITGAQEQAALPAVALADEMAAGGLDVEFADLTRLVLIPSLRQPAAAWRQLARRLRSALSDMPAAARDSAAADRRLVLEKTWRHYLTAIPEMAVRPGQVLFQPQQLQSVPLAQAAGQISARAVLPYPPGIPLIWPGERFDQPRVDFLRQMLENKISINGIDQARVWIIA